MLLETVKNFKKGRIQRTELNAEKKKYKELCEGKKRKQMEKECKEIQELRNENEIWKYINRERKNKKRETNNKIKSEEWEDYFRTLLEGKEKNQIQEKITETTKEEEDAGKGIEEMIEEEIKETELEETIRKLKKKKASGEDGLKNEAWIHANAKVKDRLREIMNKIWKGGEWPERWKKGIISPIHKKGDRDKVTNYRGVTLMNTAYKVYAMILEKRIRTEAELNGILPETQAGFRKGKSCVDNIMALKCAAEKRLRKKGGKLYVFFADLKAAFDKVDRKRLWKTMKKLGVRTSLVERVMAIYEETASTVRTGNGLTKEFWTEKGVRQGCPLSPLLFILFMADLEEHLKRGQSGGITIGRGRWYSLAYADDVAIITETKEEMHIALRKMEVYFDRKKMELNTEKSKIMVFKKGGRKEKNVWKWKEKEMEEVKTYKYLGYTFQCNNKDGQHIKEVTRRGMAAMAQIWSIGERKFGGNIKRRMMMFNVMVKSIILYGVEIWGWNEWKEVETLQEKYRRWILGLDPCTPGYITREEMKVNKIRIEAGMRAMKYEERMRRAEQKTINKECRREIGKEEWETTNWGKERRATLESGGIRSWEWEAQDDQGKDVINNWKATMEEKERMERRKRIKASRYCKQYEKWITDGTPKYIEEGDKRDKIKEIARFRCGNDFKESRFWEDPERKLCRMCEEHTETIEHVIKECRWTGQADAKVEEYMEEHGRRHKNIKEIRRIREEKEKNNKKN